MNDITKHTLSFFDLEDTSKDMQEDFLEDIGEVLMESVFRKAWSELDANKREALTKLLEESSLEPENAEKSNAVLMFLDEHVVNIKGYVEKEFESIQTTYKKTRDELRDIAV